MVSYTSDMETSRTPMSRWGGEQQVPLQTRIGRIAAVREFNGVPIGAYDVILDNDQQESDVPMLLPASSYLYKSGNREHGASGLVPIAQVGDNCLVIYVGTQMGLAQPFILGFFAPRSDGEGGDYPNPKRVRPGSLVLATPYGNGIVIRNGGVIEIEAEPHVKRVMTPAASNATDVTGAMIADRCRNYRLLTASGEMRMGEIGGGRSNMQFRVNEFSSFGNTRSLKAALTLGQAILEEDVLGALTAAEELFVERFVEVTWGSAGQPAPSPIEAAAVAAGIEPPTVEGSAAPPENLATERYFGPDGEVRIEYDGAGGRVVSADQVSELRVAGGIVSVTARSDGSYATTSVDRTHLVLGAVTYNVAALFNVTAPLINLQGIVVIQGGGLPSARIGDAVVVGDRVGEIITGSPNLIH